MTSIASPERGHSGRLGSASQPGRAGTTDRWIAGLTLPMVAVGVYLWVIHSHKLAIATPALVVGLLGLLVQRAPLRVPAPWLWFAGLVAWHLVTAPLSDAPDAALAGSWEYIKLGTVFLLVCNVAQTRRQVLTFMVLWLGIFALYPVRGTLFNLLGGISTQGRYAWNFIFSNPNDLALYTIPMVSLAVGIIPITRGWTRTAAVTGAALLPGVIFATQSRGGILALLAMALVLGRDLMRRRQRPAHDIAERRQRRRRGRAIAGIAALAVVGVLAFAPSGVWERLKGLRAATDTEQLGEVDPEGSAEQRWEIWRVSWAITADHPLTGIGAGMYPKVHQQYATRSTFKRTAAGPRDTHSAYFNVMAEGGIPALLLFLGMVFAAFRLMARTIAGSGEAAHLMLSLRAGLVAFLFGSVFNSSQQVVPLYVFLGVICLVGLAYGPPTVAPAPRQPPRAASP